MSSEPMTVTVTKAQVIAACANPTFPGGGDGHFIGQYIWAGLNGEAIDHDEARRRHDDLDAETARADKAEAELARRDDIDLKWWLCVWCQTTFPYSDGPDASEIR